MPTMPDESRIARFESTVLVHLDAAWRFARWMVGDQALAEDALQDACVNALRGFESRTGSSARGWFMAVVRNACLDALRDRRRRAVEDAWDDAAHDGVAASESAEATAARASDARWIRAEIARLPAEFREVIVLRELEELSYREISDVVRVPIGTVMSRLARAREMLAERVRTRAQREQA
jgi:RNA polymerase sigma factor (sigma-70 family)